MRRYTMDPGVAKEYAKSKRIAERALEAHMAEGRYWDENPEDCDPLTAQQWNDGKDELNYELCVMGLGAWYFGSSDFKKGVDAILDANEPNACGFMWVEWKFRVQRKAVAAGESYREYLEDYVWGYNEETDEHAEDRSLDEADEVTMKELIDDEFYCQFKTSVFYDFLKSDKFRASIDGGAECQK